MDFHRTKYRFWPVNYLELKTLGVFTAIVSSRIHEYLMSRASRSLVYDLILPK